ncbi:hypothetical protein [Mycoplasmoides alvi]|uniref:hypothetical protein n=1 Tax=Mycoplasmoides alvi TaxID=78580 RepID=UPI00051B7A6F|nr:hypothetical protein [Mycoplasmoides alvi]
MFLHKSKKSKIKLISLIAISLGLVVIISNVVSNNVFSTDQSLIIKNNEVKLDGPIDDVIEVLKRVDTSNTNKTTLDYTDAKQEVTFSNYDQNGLDLLEQVLQNNKNYDFKLTPKARISDDVNVTIGYSYPLYEYGTSDIWYTRDFINSYYTNKQNYVNSPNTNLSSKVLAYCQSHQLPPTMGTQNPNFVFQLSTYENNKNTWIWQDENLFDLGKEIVARKGKLNPQGDLYLWFVQTGTKIKYKAKTFDPEKLKDFFSNGTGKGYTETGWKEWLNSWNEEFVLPETTSIKFLDITSSPNSYCTSVSAMNAKDISQTPKEWIEYHYKYSAVPSNNDNNSNANTSRPIQKRSVELTPQIGDWWNQVTIPDNLLNDLNPKNYNFQDGIAFYVKVPNSTLFDTHDGKISLSSLINSPANVKDVIQYTELKKDSKNLQFFGTSKPAVKQQTLRIFSDESPIRDNDRNYALKRQILDFIQTPNLDITNFIVPKTEYDSSTKKNKLTFDFNPTLKDLILNLYNLSIKAKELKVADNNLLLLRQINNAMLDYKQAYKNALSSQQSLYSANWYLNAERDFGLNLKLISAVENPVYVTPNNSFPTDGPTAIVTHYPTPWLQLLSWIKDYFSHDIYAEYSINSVNRDSSVPRKAKIWDANAFNFTNEIQSLYNTSEITITNIYSEKTPSENLVSKLKMDNNSDCKLENNKLVYSYTPQTPPDNWNPSNPGDVTPPANQNPGGNGQNGNIEEQTSTTNTLTIIIPSVVVSVVVLVVIGVVSFVLIKRKKKRVSNNS